MKGKCLRTQLKAQHQIPLKPSKTSPPLASIAKMGENNYKVNVVRVPPQRVHFSKCEWSNKHIFNDEYTRRKSNYIEDQKIANEKYDKEASTNEASNQKIQITKYKIWCYDKTKGVL